jgi:hypothetical protein
MFVPGITLGNYTCGSLCKTNLRTIQTIKQIRIMVPTNPYPTLVLQDLHTMFFFAGVLNSTVFRSSQAHSERYGDLRTEATAPIGFRGVGLIWKAERGVHEMRTGSNGIVIGSFGRVRQASSQNRKIPITQIVGCHCGLTGSAKRGQDCRGDAAGCKDSGEGSRRQGVCHAS